MKTRTVILIAVVVVAVLGFVLFRKLVQPDAAVVQVVQRGYDYAIIQAATKFDMPYARIGAMVAVESKGNPKAVGKAGERGLMQLTRAALEDVNATFGLNYLFDDMFDPLKNVMAGTAYLKLLQDKYFPPLDTATRAYNGGIKWVKAIPGWSGLYLYRVKLYEPFFTLIT